MRFHIACFPKELGDSFSIDLRSTLDSFTNTSMGKPPNKIIVHGMRLDEDFDVTDDVDAQGQTEITDAKFSKQVGSC